MDQVNLDAWIGRLDRTASTLSVEQASLIHATLGQGASPAHGDLLPPLWHWCAFPPAAPMTALGSDGHPRGVGPMPPVHLPRRMWAGGQLTFHAPLRIGDPMERTTTVRSVTEKDGASGPMVFVTVDHAIYGPQGLAIEERQDIVYLDMPKSFQPPKPRRLRGAVVGEINADEMLLFRYSALTFNAHRIHYDKAYATEVEKYPGLVVHGPLQATLLIQAAIRHAERLPRQFDFRGVHPLFAGDPVSITLEEDEGALNLWTGQHGHQGMQATAIWEGTV